MATKDSPDNFGNKRFEDVVERMLNMPPEPRKRQEETRKDDRSHDSKRGRQ